MAKKSFNFNQDYIILFCILIIILLAVYLIHIKLQSKKKMIENFYQSASPVEVANALPQPPSGYTAYPIPQNILYIYVATRRLSSCKAIENLLATDPTKISSNAPLAGIPAYSASNTAYNPASGFSSKYIGVTTPGSPGIVPKSPSGILFDYIATTLTNEATLSYYKKDAANSTSDPIDNAPYIYSKNVDKTPINDFSLIMIEYFKALIAMDNNTTICFIKYYYRSSASKNAANNKYYLEIPDSDLQNAMNNNNVIVYFENINIIKFLQVENPSLYNTLSKYSDDFNMHFIDPTGIAK
jgi:hypothetical protein